MIGVIGQEVGLHSSCSLRPTDLANGAGLFESLELLLVGDHRAWHIAVRADELSLIVREWRDVLCTRRTVARPIVDGAKLGIVAGRHR